MMLLCRPNKCQHTRNNSVYTENIVLDPTSGGKKTVTAKLSINFLRIWEPRGTFEDEKNNTRNGEKKSRGTYVKQGDEVY